MKQIALITGGVVLAFSLIVGASTFFQANGEELRLSADLQYRTRVLADSLEESIGPPFASRATSTVQKIVNRIADNDRVAGLAVYDAGGALVASSSPLVSGLAMSSIIVSAMDSGTASGAFSRTSTGRAYVFADPLMQDDRTIGALVIVQNASYIDDVIQKIWTDNLTRLLLQLLLVGAAIFALVRWVFFKPLFKLVENMRQVRSGQGNGAPTRGEHDFLIPLASEISRMSTSLQHARFVAGQEARMRLEKLDSPWTAERLKEFVKLYLKKRPIYVISNREPYIHYKEKGRIAYSVPAHGMVTAVESVMEACGGTWIAHGSGSADRQVVDEHDKIAVPPDEPKYTLKRVWLSDKDVAGHYAGFSNDALFPLCHTVYMRPTFKREDWESYRRVNGKFAASFLEDAKEVQRPMVLVQDLHFAILPELIKKARPDANIGLFWHHPWPSAEQFSVCPWRREILEGMLGADIIGFHTQQYCNNFIETVGKELEALIDPELFSITYKGHTTYVKPFPISTAFAGGPKGEEEHAPARTILNRLGIQTKYVALGVERMDYIKGLVEKFRGVEELLDSHPQYRNEFTLLQIAAPSREAVEKYREYQRLVVAEAERINARFANKQWKPIVLENVQYGRGDIHDLYQLADVCMVTSLHDGMNLVAKEFVSARSDEEGVLILSKFTGASRALKDALIVNPYSAADIANAVHAALTMSRLEQRQRMQSMRNSVKNYNVYRWAAEFLKSVADLG